MILDIPLIGTELSSKNNADSAVQVYTSYAIDKTQITSVAVHGEIVRKMGDSRLEVVGAGNKWCSADLDVGNGLELAKR